MKMTHSPRFSFGFALTLSLVVLPVVGLAAEVPPLAPGKQPVQTGGGQVVGAGQVSGTALGNQAASRPHTIMHPDNATMLKWFQAHEAMPKAPMAPKSALLAPGASRSLLLHLDYVPAERDQGYCGNCWCWAGHGCLEILLDVQNGIFDRLSVQEMNSCETAAIGKTCCDGGWLSDLQSFYSATGYKRAVPWSNPGANWQDWDASCDTTCASITTTPNYPVQSITAQSITTHGVGQAQAIANIKAILNQNKPVAFAFFMATQADWNTFFSTWDNGAESTTVNLDYACGHTWDSGGGGHEVLCVGYNDDNPSDPYWIMVNSWGTTANRPNDIFHVKMNNNYDCTFYYGGWYYSYYWEYLDVTYTTPANLVVTPASLNYGTLAVGQSSTQSFSVINGGQSSLTGTATVSGPFAIASGSPYNVAGGQTGLVAVSFSPTDTGSFTTNVVFASNGGASTNAVTGIGAILPVAVFSGTPTNGVVPLTVTFADTSTGTITNRFWNFGDSTTTNTTATNVQHTYNTTGTDTVTLIVSGPLGVSTNTRSNYVMVLGAYQGWQMQYFGCTACPQAAGTADPDGDGQDNLTEFLVGTDPTNSLSSWRIQASPTNGLVPLLVNFSENSTGSSITNRLWDFGDGGVGSGSNPSHTYTNVGTFSVGLTIFNVNGTATLVATNLVTGFPFATWTNANASGNWSYATSWNPVTVPDFGASVVFASAGATAVVDNVSRTVSNVTFSRSGNFSVTAAGGAALTINNGIAVTTNFTYTVAAPVVLGGTNTWSVTSNGTLQVIGPVSGTNTLAKTGGGTLIFSGTNTYSGGTTISNGTLQVAGAGLITNTASIDIASGATLDVSGRTGGSMTLVSGQTLKGGGTVQGNLILAGGSVLSPGGSSVGTLTFLNDLVVSNAAVLQYDLGTNSDLTAVNSNLTLGGTLNIGNAGGFGVGTYTLFTYGGTLTYNGVTIGTAPSGYAYTIDTATAGQVKLNVTPPPMTILIDAGDLQDRLGNLAAANSVAVLVVDTGTNGFVDLQPGFALSLGATWGTDDKVVGLWDLSAGGDGWLSGQTVVPYTCGVVPGQRLQLYWFPSLTLSSNTLGIAYYGRYTDTNSPPLDSSGVWEMPGAGSQVYLTFVTASEGGHNPDAAGRAALLTAMPAVAGFSASPTNGVAPLAVTFTDTSTGTITNRFWDFGDGSTSNTTATSLSHMYGAGTYTVTLVVSGSGGASTNTQPNYITVLTPFAAWQTQYFGCTNCPQAAETADPDGDGQNNLAEFLVGTNPTNSASVFHIISIVQDGDDLRVAWIAGGGRTNVVQAANDAGSGFTNNFSDLGPLYIIPGADDVLTNYLDVGGATNTPSRFYRVRLVP
jgi:autotransporter-associated beta strand protein